MWKNCSRWGWSNLRRRCDVAYRTEYTLTVFDQGEELVGLVYEKLRREFPPIAEACNIEGQIVDSCKWYTHEEDMVRCYVVGEKCGERVIVLGPGKGTEDAEV